MLYYHKHSLIIELNKYRGLSTTLFQNTYVTSCIAFFAYTGHLKEINNWLVGCNIAKSIYQVVP